MLFRGLTAGSGCATAIDPSSLSESLSVSPGGVPIRVGGCSASSALARPRPDSCGPGRQVLTPRRTMKSYGREKQSVRVFSCRSWPRAAGARGAASVRGCRREGLQARGAAGARGCKREGLQARGGLQA